MVLEDYINSDALLCFLTAAVLIQRMVHLQTEGVGQTVQSDQHSLCLHLLDRSEDLSRIWATGSQMHKGDHQNSSSRPDSVFSSAMADT